MGNREMIEARLHDAQQLHYSERSMSQQQMVERDQAEKDAREDEAIAERVIELMRDPTDEALAWISDCMTTEDCMTLAKSALKALMAPNESARMIAIQGVAVVCRPHLECFVGYTEFGGVRT